jgi:hypothetical protein
VARVSAKGCRVGRGVWEVRGAKARGRKWRRRREGRVGGDCVREASFPTKYLPSASGLVWALKQVM